MSVYAINTCSQKDVDDSNQRDAYSIDYFYTDVNSSRIAIQTYLSAPVKDRRMALA